MSAQDPDGLETSSGNKCCKPGKGIVCPRITIPWILTPAEGNREQPWRVPACCFSSHAASGTETAARSCLQ